MGLLSYQPSYRVFLFDLFCSSMPCKGFFGLCGVNTKLKKKKDQWWQIIKYFWEGMEPLLSGVPVFH